jgi:hypothetical protein
MERSLELFDQHADMVFEHFLRLENSREKALTLTEAFFMAHAGMHDETPLPVPTTASKKLLLRPYFNVRKYLMKFSS